MEDKNWMRPILFFFFFLRGLGTCWARPVDLADEQGRERE